MPKFKVDVSYEVTMIGSTTIEAEDEFTAEDKAVKEVEAGKVKFEEEFGPDEVEIYATATNLDTN